MTSTKTVERICYLCDGQGSPNKEPPYFNCTSCNGTGVVMEIDEDDEIICDTCGDDVSTCRCWQDLDED